MIGGQAIRTWTSRASPRSLTCEIRARIVVERTIVSSTRSTRLSFKHLGQGVYFMRTLSARFCLR